MNVGDLVKVLAPGMLGEETEGLAVITKVKQSMENGFVVKPNHYAYEIAFVRLPYKSMDVFECEVTKFD